jgi:hypothetical protein
MVSISRLVGFLARSKGLSELNHVAASLRDAVGKRFGETLLRAGRKTFRRNAATCWSVNVSEKRDHWLRGRSW